MIQTNSREISEDDSDVTINAPSEIQLPDTGMDYLVGHFFNSGQALQTGQGLVPLTWQELEAYTKLNELDMCTWELKLLKKMSEAYCVEHSRASDEKREAPYRVQVLDEDVDQVAKALRIKQGMAGFRKRKG